jgi:predicted deacylase
MSASREKRKRGEPLVIARERIARGETREVMLPVAESYLGHTECIPIYVMRAKKAGPRVFLAGALHGDELNGMGIVRELLYGKPPELLKGTLILMPILNIHGLARHSRYMPDRRDPNRSFPGSSGGSLTSRFAHAVFNEVVRQCDFGIDYHSAAVRRTNYPNVRAYLRDAGTRRLAKAFGAELIVNSRGPAGSLRRAAVAAGVPTIILEAGEVWKIEPGVVEVGVRGTLNVLKELGMIAGEPQRPAFQMTVTKATWVRSELGGVLGFHARPGQVVRAGEGIATVYSLFGREQTSLLSPVNGIVLGMTTMPVVQPGGPVYHLAVLSSRQFSVAARQIRDRAADSPYSRIAEDLATNITLHGR